MAGVFTPHPRPSPKVSMPRWVPVSLLVSSLLVILGLVVARVGAVTSVNAATGQTYGVRLGHGGNWWYVDYWRYAIYQATTWAGFTLFAIAMLYAVGKNLWSRYGQ